MSDAHFVVLGLAPVRASWFSDLSRWSTSAALPVDFVKCVGPEELHARLASGRPWSAVLVDGALPSLDRDLVDEARSLGTPVIAIDSGRAARDWEALGVSAVVLEPLEREALLAVLRRHGRPLHRLDTPASAHLHAPAPTGWRGRLVAVTGAGGSGASTIAAAVAQALAADARQAGRVVLADLALRADHALLHDVGDVIPGVQELVDAHRSTTLTSEAVRALTFVDERRGYYLLLGLRRQRDWAALRRRAFEAALDGLRHAFSITVAQVDPDVEGEDECGSIEVEERNLLSRTVMAAADLVIVTGAPGVSGVHRLARILDELLAFGVEPTRVLPIVNRAPRHPRSRASIAEALATFTARAGSANASSLPAPLFVPERRRLELCHHDAVPLPRPFVEPIGEATAAVLDHGGVVSSIAEPVPVKPGTLGSWHDEQAG